MEISYDFEYAKMEFFRLGLYKFENGSMDFASYTEQDLLNYAE